MRTIISTAVILLLVHFLSFSIFAVNMTSDSQKQKRGGVGMSDKTQDGINEVKGGRTGKIVPYSTRRDILGARPEKKDIQFQIKKGQDGNFRILSRRIWILDANGKKCAAEVFWGYFEGNVRHYAYFEGAIKTTSNGKFLFPFGIVSLCGSADVIWMGPLPFEVTDMDAETFLQSGTLVKEGESLKVIALHWPTSMNVYTLMPKKVTEKIERHNTDLICKLLYENCIDSYLFCAYDSLHGIHFINLFQRGFFGGLGGGSGWVRLRNVTAEKGLFCVEFENPAFGNIAKIWLDLCKMKIVKHEEMIHPNSQKDMRYL